MNCPEEIASILSAILTRGLLRIRNGSMDCDRTRMEADHLHNLLTRFEPCQLMYYWDIERASYLSQTGDDPRDEALETLWKELEPCVFSIRAKMDRTDSIDPR